MVSFDITPNFWMGYHEEAAYASGGHASAALTEEALSAGEVLAIDRVISCDANYAAPERDEQFDLGSGLYPSYIKDLKTMPGEIVLVCYMQTDDFYDYAISATAIGSLGTSLTLHIDNGIVEQDFFGCVVKEWVGESTPGVPTKQTITFLFRDQGDGATITKVAYNTGDISVHSNVSATIDAHTSANLVVQSQTQTITNELDEEGYMLGDAKIIYPVLLSRTVDIVLEYKSRDTNTWGAGTNAVASADELITVTFFDADLVWMTTLTSDMSNVWLVETNSGVRDEHGIIKHSATFKSGVGFTIA